MSQTEKIADLMSKGLDNQQIADRTGRTRRSVNAMIQRIRQQLGWQAR